MCVCSCLSWQIPSRTIVLTKGRGVLRNGKMVSTITIGTRSRAHPVCVSTKSALLSHVRKYLPEPESLQKFSGSQIQYKAHKLWDSCDFETIPQPFQIARKRLHTSDIWVRVSMGPDPVPILNSSIEKPLLVYPVHLRYLQMIRIWTVRWYKYIPMFFIILKNSALLAFTD